MEDKAGSIEELFRWVVSVDRRLALLKSLKWHTMVKISDITHETGRSTQNISRALKKLDEKRIDRVSDTRGDYLKKYVLTDIRKVVLNELDWKYF